MKEYMTLKEVAALFRVKNATIHRWRNAGKLVGIKTGRKWLFDREYIENLMNTDV